MPDVVQKVIIANDVQNGNAVVGVNKLGSSHVLSPTLNKVPVLAEIETKHQNDFHRYEETEFMSVSIAGDGANPVVAISGVANRRIEVTNYVLSPVSAGNFQWYSDANVLSGIIGVTNIVSVNSGSLYGVLETNVGESLGLLVGASGNVVTGHIAYRLT
jgi:hypothetical protein